MIINPTNFKKTLPLICVVGLLGLLFASCQKITVPPVSNTPSAKLAITQGSPDQPFLDISIDNILVNQAPVEYATSSSYISVAAGPTPVVFMNDGTGKTVLMDTLNLAQNTYYSLFLANTTSKTESFLLTDTLNKPAAGNASLRFINLSPDAPAVDLVVTGGATLVSNRGFKGFSSFAPMAAANGYNLEVHKAGTSTVLATFTNFNMNAGFVYTIWLHGLVAGTTSADKLALDVIDNAAFL